MNFFESQALLYKRKAFKMKYLDMAFLTVKEDRLWKKENHH